MMRTRLNTPIVYPALLAVTALALIVVAKVVADGNIDPTRRFAWSTAAGWINFNPVHGGVTVYDDHLEGYAWAENTGWIRLGTHTGGGSHTYANSSNSDYGVNVDASGALSGYAWSTTAGWVNFAPTYGGVSIDLDSGSFSGYAWSENTGWIHFESDTYNVAVLPGVYISRQSGPWSSGDTWESWTTPTAMDSVTVTGGTTVTVDSSAQCYRLFVEPDGVLVIPEDVTLSVEDELVNNGTLRQTVNSVPAGSPAYFLHIQDSAGTQDRHWGVVITPTDGSMGVVTVTIRGNQDCGGGGSPVQRCFAIEPANPTTATLQFYYRSVETNTNTSPLVWRWDGMAWQLVADSLDTERGGSGDALWVRVINGPEYSPFVLAESGLVPTSIVLRALAARPDRPVAWLAGSILILGAVAVILKRKK